jgi:uncharacterized protein YdaU (DUF1376 family)
MASQKDNRFWFKLNWNAYLDDTLQLDHAQHGAYFVCMLAYYRTGKPLPLDLPTVFRMVGASTDDERKNITFALTTFFQKTDSCWRHKRIDSELEEALQHMKDKRKSSIHANEVRWHGKRSDSGSDPQTDTQSDSGSDSGSDPQNSYNNNNNKENVNSQNDDQVAAVVSFLETRHMADLGAWRGKHKPQMEAWIREHKQTFMDEAITVAKGYGLEGADSPFAVMVTTHLPKAIAKLNAERERVAQQKKADEFQAASIERQTQEIIARRDAGRTQVSEQSIEDFLEGK